MNINSMFGVVCTCGRRRNLVVATWCQRDNSTQPFTPAEEKKLDFLYSEWTHPHFISINVRSCVVVVVVATAAAVVTRRHMQSSYVHEMIHELGVAVDRNSRNAVLVAVVRVVLVCSLVGARSPHPIVVSCSCTRLFSLDLSRGFVGAAVAAQDYAKLMEGTGELEKVETADWAEQTTPTWRLSSEFIRPSSID